MDTDRKWIVVRIDGKIAAVSTDYRKLAEISAQLAMECQNETGKGAKGRSYIKGHGIYGEVTAVSESFEEVWKLRQTAKWDDLMLFGTDFQKKVWKKLWELTHHAETGNQTETQNQTDSENQTDSGNQTETGNPDDSGNPEDSKNPTETGNPTDSGNQTETQDSGRPGLISYSDFAQLCENRAGVRAVAHAVGLNPVSVIIPCHLVVPKESIDKIADIRRKMESTIFKGDDICMGSLLGDKGLDFGEYALGRELKRRLIQLELS